MKDCLRLAVVKCRSNFVLEQAVRGGNVELPEIHISYSMVLQIIRADILYELRSIFPSPAGARKIASNE